MRKYQKYQTAVQIMLDILFEEVNEEIELSKQRLDVFARDNDLETLKLEHEGYDMLMKKKRNIESLMDCEKYTSCNRMSFVEIGYTDAERNKSGIKSYISDNIGDKNEINN